MGIGPVIEHGFYYDFDLPRSLSPDDLDALDAACGPSSAPSCRCGASRWPAPEALAHWRAQGDPYKVELIEDLPPDVALSFYEQGGPEGFTDLCRGPHVRTTGDVTPHFKLMSVAGAYWRGDEKRPMMQRVYGVAFATAEELEKHLWQLEEGRRRDHRKLGAELDLFVLDDDVGPGLPLWLPRGTVLVEQIERLAKEMELAAGYQQVRTPHVSKEQLFLKSGHLPYYAESMYPPDGARARPLLHEADELPVPPQDLRGAPALLPRPARAAVRVRHLLPLRGLRRPDGPDAGAQHADERRPHLLLRGAVRGRVPGRRRPLPALLRAVRHRGVRHALLEARAGGARQEVRRRAGAVAAHRGDDPAPRS
jgi:hypothetical protein